MCLNWGRLQAQITQMKFRLLFILIFYTSKYFCQDNINNIIEPVVHFK